MWRRNLDDEEKLEMTIRWLQATVENIQEVIDGMEVMLQQQREKAEELSAFVEILRETNSKEEVLDEEDRLDS